MALALPSNASPAVRSAHMELSDQIERARALVRNVKDDQKELTGRLAHWGLNLLAGGAAGYYQGRYGDTIRWGLPTTTWATIAFTGVGMWRLFKSGGKEGHHMLSIGAGLATVAFAGWLARKGVEERMALPAGGSPAAPQVAAGAAPVGMRMTSEMLQNYANTFA